MKDNKSKLAVFKKLNSYKANLNRSKKRSEAELAANTLIKNNNNKLVIYKKQLIKKKYNPSTYKPILVSNSSTAEIAINNSKLL